jgi:type VI secretion system protein ImpC
MSQERWGEVNLDVTAGREHSLATPNDDVPFRIAILGDFSGRANRDVVEAGPALQKRIPVRVDRDDFDEVMSRLAPSLSLSLDPDVNTSLEFRDLDDFHPDRLYARVPIFRSLRELRARLADANTFHDAARDLGMMGSDRDSGAASATTGSRSLLEDILGGPLAAAEPVRRHPDDLQEVVRRIVAPHLVAAADPRQREMLEQVDLAIAERMRTILHHPDFQQLEALWRSVLQLVRALDTDTGVQIHLVDVSLPELMRDLATTPAERSAMHRILVDASVGTPGAHPWALLAGAYEFSAAAEDLALLAGVGELAQRAGAPFIGQAAPRLVGCDSYLQLSEMDHWTEARIPGWESMRSRGVASWIGLAAPRVLTRTPYGGGDEQIESFLFEEVTVPPAHGDLSWGSPVFVCARLLAQGFLEAGWGFTPGRPNELSGLPLHLYRSDGEATAVPCAEILMTERVAHGLLERGVMPIASLKESDSIRVIRFQSIASPLAPLAGRWSRAVSS